MVKQFSVICPFLLLLLIGNGAVSKAAKPLTGANGPTRMEEPNGVDFVLLMSGVQIDMIEAPAEKTKNASVQTIGRGKRGICGEGYDLEHTCKWVLFDGDEDAPWIYRECSTYCVSSFMGMAFVAVGAIVFVVTRKQRQQNTKRVTFRGDGDDPVYKEIVEQAENV